MRGPEQHRPGWTAPEVGARSLAERAYVATQHGRERTVAFILRPRLEQSVCGYACGSCDAALSESVVHGTLNQRMNTHGLWRCAWGVGDQAEAMQPGQCVLDSLRVHLLFADRPQIEACDRGREHRFRKSVGLQQRGQSQDRTG